MYIRKLQIRNIRGFKEVDLDLTRPDGSLAGWTVLAGRNGSGKSSFLRILAITIVGTSEARGLGANIRQWQRFGTRSGKVTVDLAGIKKRGSQRQTLHLTGSVIKETVGPRDIAPWDRSPNDLFLAGYGPYRRLSGSAVEAQGVMAGSDISARLVTLFREDASLLESVTWLREIYLRRLENRPGAAELENAVLSILNDGLLPDGVVIEKIDSEGLWVQQHGLQVPLTELSDGYRTTAALVMDILRHLHQCFEHLEIGEVEDKSGSYKCVFHEGVVLIDEVDLHLHISWQKRIGFWLKSHFPKIQFIVTTHSPFVCQAADPKGLIRLPAPGEDRSAEHVSEELYNTVVNGSLDEAVLTELFGLDSPYSEPAEKLRERVAYLEAQFQIGKATKAEKREYQELSARLPQTPVTAVEQALRKLAADA